MIESIKSRKGRDVNLSTGTARKLGSESMVEWKLGMDRELRWVVLVIGMIAAINFIPCSANAQVSLEKQFQQVLKFSKSNIFRILNSSDTVGSMGQLKEIIQQIHFKSDLLHQKLTIDREIIAKMGPLALQRYEKMIAEFSQFVEILNAIQAGDDATIETLSQLNDFLNDVQPEPHQPIYGSLTYKNLFWPKTSPTYEPQITAAYQGGDQQTAEEDFKGSPEAPISETIAQHAESLDWNPVRIYEWVKNNVKTDWYYGCMKGAESTLRQKKGNDCDQAALLVALLRSAGYATRYVRGVIEFYPNLEFIKNITGMTNSTGLSSFFQKAGIPFKAITGGGKIKNYQLEHIWVETKVPYTNYRGVPQEQTDLTWIALDTSIKSGFEIIAGKEIPQQIDLETLRELYLQEDRQETPREFVQVEIESAIEQYNLDITFDELVHRRIQKGEETTVLPGALQFKQVAVTAEYTELPAELIHTTQFRLADYNGFVYFDDTIPTYHLSSQMISLVYEPETIEDQEIVNANGGIHNTPAYLLNLRPVLEVGGVRYLIGLGGKEIGTSAILSIEQHSPSGSDAVANEIIFGNSNVVALVSGSVEQPSPLAAEEKDGQRLLFEAALGYIDRWNESENFFSSLFGVELIRPMPAIVRLGGVVEITSLLGRPHQFEWKGVFVDADRKNVEIPGKFGQNQVFMRWSAMEGSVLEDRILRDSFQVDSISTARLFALANMQQVPIITVDSTNVDAFLDSNSLASNVELDLRNAANAGQTIRILSQEFSFEDWRGIGYIKEDNQTGESAWMLSGDIAGGMVVWDKSRWDDYFLDRVSNPYAEPASFDTTLQRFIQKVALSDLETKTVGETIVLSVQVYDEKNRGIKGESVLFTIKSGGGHFPDGSEEASRITGEGGTASIVLALGLHTKDDPWWKKANPSDMYAQQFGKNIVDATLENGIASIQKPFVIYGEPDFESKQGKFSQDSTKGDIFTFAGCLHTRFEDQHQNPIYNDVVEFVAVPLPAPDEIWETKAVLVDPAAPCVGRSPTHGECQEEHPMIQKTVGPGGASACIILGSIPNATQLVHTVFGENGSHDFSISVNDFGHFYADAQSPEYRFLVFPEERYDSQGNKIIVARAGKEIPVGAKMMLLREQHTYYDYPWKIGYRPDPSSDDTWGCLCRPGEEPDPVNSLTKIYNHWCRGSAWPHFGLHYGNPNTWTGIKMVGHGKEEGFKIDYEFKNEVVTFTNGQTTRNGFKITEGYYSASMPIQTGINIIQISATAQTKEPLELCFDCEELGRPCLNRTIEDYSYCFCDMLVRTNDKVYADQTSIQTITVYGIDFDTDETALVALDEDNTASSDVVIPISILPIEYAISNAVLEITRDGVPISYTAIDDNSDSVTISKGFQFNPESEYKAQIVIHFNTDHEIRSDHIRFKFARFYLEKNDPDFPNVKLRYSDYYPPLGDKEIIIKGILDEGDVTEYRVMASIERPEADAGFATIDGTVRQTTERFDNQGVAKVSLSARTLAPEYSDEGNTYGVNHIKVVFDVLNADDKIVSSFQHVWNVKNNYNTTMGEVLDGQAVFVYDDNDDDNHVGTTSADTMNLRMKKFDYVQELLNQILPRKRSINSHFPLLDIDGAYGSSTTSAINEFRKEFLVDMPRKSRTFEKIRNDYDTSLSQNSIIDKMILIGEMHRREDDTINTSTADDTGLLELYENVVYPFVEAMIKEAERYAGFGEGVLPTMMWTSRAGHGPGFHGVGMSYSYGGFDTVDSYNLSVAPCGAPLTAVIDYRNNYRGNLWFDPLSTEGVSIPEYICEIHPYENMRWPGLKQNELEVWKNDKYIKDHRYNKNFWAGIDCSGLVLKTISHANSTIGTKAKSSIPSNRINADSIFFSGNLDITATFYFGYDDPGDLPNDIDESQLRRGDFLGNRIDPSHIVIFYSHKPSKNVLGVRKWQIIHAYGHLDKNEKDFISNDKKREFARKVVLSADNKQLEGLGSPDIAGRITLWD